MYHGIELEYNFTAAISCRCGPSCTLAGFKNVAWCASGCYSNAWISLCRLSCSTGSSQFRRYESSGLMSLFVSVLFTIYCRAYGLCSQKVLLTGCAKKKRISLKLDKFQFWKQILLKFFHSVVQKCGVWIDPECCRRSLHTALTHFVAQR